MDDLRVGPMAVRWDGQWAVYSVDLWANSRVALWVAL